MQTVELSTEKRELSTKGALRQLRAAGRVPATVYGGKKDPVNASVDAKELSKHLKAHGHNILVNLKGGAGADLTLLQGLQKDVLTHQPIHADFRRVSLSDTLEISVPLHVKGEAPGVKTQGGILEMIVHDLPIKCLVSDIPSHIDVDVSQLSINHGIKVKELLLPKGVEVLADGERLVINIVAPTEFKEETPAAAAAVPGAAEPEVIAKGKKPEEGAEGAAAAPAAGGKAAPAAGAKPAAPAAGGKAAAPAAPAKK